MPEPIEYTIGWICAIRTELVAATAILDEKHDDPEHLPVNDDNAYVLGRIGKHNVVIAALPHGQYGLVSAAKVATDMLRSFTNVRVGLMVGLGGGAPNQKHDIRLGDIVVGCPGNGRGGVLQYDYGKTIQGRDFKLTGHLNQPPQCLLTALAVLAAQYEIDGHDIQAQINRVVEKKPRLRVSYQKPDFKLDCLYIPSFEHAGSDTDTCAATCNDSSKLVKRVERSPEQDSPVIHYGIIASANQLMKDSRVRDQLSTKEDILCFEMEAAGLMNSFPCLVIRGICDYSDSHKNKVWQGYAAMAAAAFAKDLLQKVAPSKVAAERRLTEVLSNVDTRLSIISGTLGESQRNLEALHTDRQTEGVMRWLAAAEVSSNLNKAIETRHKGSGHKLIQDEAYIKWKKHSKSFLWLNGIPGCGKTILASTIIEELKSDPECSQSLLYYYFDFTDTQKQDFKVAIRSLLAQFYLKSESAKAELDSLYSSCKNGWEQPSMILLESTFASIVQKVGRVYVVMDALDECLIRHDLLEWLRDLRAEQMNAHVLVTSRPEQDIQSFFSRFCDDQEIVTIQNELLEDDIRNYVQARVREHEALSRWQNRPDIQKEIETTLVQKANGMFRWIACQLDALEKCCDPTTLRLTLASLPKTLDETYERILAKIPSEHMRHAIRLLQFLTHSERPLRVNEAVDAIAVEVGPEVPKGSRFDTKNRMPIPAEITIFCSSLVVLARKKLKRASSRPKHIIEEVQLAHFSVKDYLTSERLETEAARYLKETSARSLMAEVCLTYLLELDPRATELQQKRMFPFSEYSANFWANHAAVGEQHSSAVRKLALELLRNPESIAICRQLQTRFWESPLEDTATGLYYASLLGLPRCVGMLLEQGAEVNAQGGLYNNALQAASAKGNLEVVRLLIENGANTCSKGGKYGSALRAAVYGEHSEVIQLLTTKSYLHNQEGFVGQNSCIKLADVGLNGPQLLREATIDGNVGLVDVLLDLNVTPETVPPGGNMLHLAVEVGNNEVFRMLLNREAADMTPHYRGMSPLSLAAYKGRLEMVKVLLDKGAYWSVTDNAKRTALDLAIHQGETEIVNLLLERGADHVTARYRGETPLHFAANRGHFEVVKLLLEKGADCSVEDEQRRTPLHLAAGKGDVEVGMIPGKMGAGWPPISAPEMAEVHRAASNTYRKVVQLLLNKGANATALDFALRSSLFYAIRIGSKTIFDILLDRTPSLVNLKDYYGSTALSMASRFGRLHMVKRIVASEQADLVAVDQFGRGALRWAQLAGHDDIASYLFDSARRRGIAVTDASWPIGISAHFDGSGLLCDVCWSSAYTQVYYHCKRCLSGRFDICSVCARLGARCIDGSHVLLMCSGDNFEDDDTEVFSTSQRSGSGDLDWSSTAGFLNEYVNERFPSF